MLEPRENHFTKEEELELGRQVQEGLKATCELSGDKSFTREQVDELNRVIQIGQKAQETLFSIEIGLANNLATKLYKQARVRYDIQDMAQDAYLAVVAATKTYNPNKNCRFSTHAYYNIYKQVSTSLNRMRPVRLPENKMGQYLKITNAEKEYMDKYNDYNENAMQEYVLKTTNIPSDVYASIKNALQPITSTQSPISQDTVFGDLLEDKDEHTDKDIQDPMLSDLLDTLDKNDREMIILAYSVGRAQMSYDEYLIKHNMTSEELNRKVQSILRKLRKELLAEENEREAM